MFDKALKVRQARSNGNLSQLAPGNVTMAITTIGQVAEIVTIVILGKVRISLGWKWTMIVGIAGHAARFAAFSFFGNEDHQWIIIAVQVLHGICYAFFFATLYIFVDEVFPKRYTFLQS